MNTYGCLWCLLIPQHVPNLSCCFFLLSSPSAYDQSMMQFVQKYPNFFSSLMPFSFLCLKVPFPPYWLCYLHTRLHVATVKNRWSFSHTWEHMSSSHPAHLSHSNTLCWNTLPYIFMRRLQMKASANYAFNSRFSSTSRGTLRECAKGLIQRLWSSDLREFCPHVVQQLLHVVWDFREIWRAMKKFNLFLQGLNNIPSG